MKYCTQLKFAMITIVLVFITFFTYAQNEVPNDPFNKPNIWEKVVDTPNEKSLWVQYFGKPWIALSVVERERVSLWRKQLNSKNYEKELRGDVYASRSEDIWKDALHDSENNEEMHAKVEVEKAQFHQMLTTHVMPENELLSELKQNVEANFIILEDIYKAEFSELGADYTAYETEHPDGKYSKILWVEHQTRKLNQLKNDYLSELKSSAVH